MSNVFDKKIVNGEVALKLLQGLKSKVDSTDIQAKRVKGVLDISNIPQSALPTLVVVQDDDERFKLTQDRVKKGDTVKVIKTNKLYLVTDTSQLSSPSGYTEYAQTVEWENIEGKPSSFPPSVHSQTSDSISHMKLYQKGSDTSDITTNDTLNVAIGKLEAKLDIKLNKIESGLNGEEKDVVKSLNKNSGQFIKSKIDNINQITQQGWYLCNSNCEGAPTEYEGIVVNYLTGNGNSVKIWYSVTQESVYIMQDLFGAERKEWTQVITQTDIDGMKETITQAIEKKQNKIDDMLVTSSKEIVGAINELHTQKQNANDGRLNTDAKEVVGAINELKEGKAELIHSHNDLYTTTEQLTQLLAGKEDVFVKNTAFNKNFGTTSGTVADGKAVEDLRVELSNISEKVAPMIEGKLDKTGGKITGNLEIDGNLVTKNNTGVQCKDSSGIAKTVIYMDDTDTIKVGDGNVSIVIDSENVTLKGGKTLWDSQNFNPTAKQDVNDSHLQTENKTVVGSINEVLTLTKKVSSDLATKAPLVHDHDDSYMPRQELDETINTLTVEIQSKEPAIVDKGTAFNKDFGTTVGTVLEGTHLATITSKIEEKQNKTDISLETQSKEIVGAINEIKKNTISATGGNINGAIQSLEFNGRGNYNIVSSLESGAQVHGTFAGRARSSTGVGEILVYNKTSSSGIRFKDDGNVTIEGKTLTAQASNLQTSSKDVVGAINELKTKKLDLSGGTLVGHADMLKLDTAKPSDSSYIKFLNGGVEKGWIGKGSSATDSIAIHNSTSNKGMTFRHDGALQLDATNLRTKNKEVVGAINELVTTKLSTDGSTKMTGSLSFSYGNPTTPNIKFLDSSGSIHGSLNSRGGGVDEDIYLENNVSGNGIYFKDNGEVRFSAKKSMWIGAPNLETGSKEIVGAINELNKNKLTVKNVDSRIGFGQSGDAIGLFPSSGDEVNFSSSSNNVWFGYRQVGARPVTRFNFGKSTGVQGQGASGEVHCGTINTTHNGGNAVTHKRGDYTLMVGCSNTAGDFLFGGKANSESDYSAYIRVAKNKLQYHNGTTYNIYHSGNKPTDIELIQGRYTGSGGKQNPSYIPSGKVRFNMMNTTVNGDGGYKDWILMDTYSGGDVPVVTAFGISKSSSLKAFIMNGTKGGGTWDRSAELWSTANFNPNTKLDTGWLSSRTLSNYNTPATQGVNFQYANTNTPNRPSGTDHAVMTMAYSGTWFYQMAGDWRTSDLYVRGSNNNATSPLPWRKVWTEGNFNPNAKLNTGGGTMTGSLTIGTNSSRSKLRVVSGSDTLALAVPNDESNYITFVKNNASSSARKAWFGFGDSNSSTFTMKNDLSGKYVAIGTSVGVNTDLRVTEGSISIGTSGKTFQAYHNYGYMCGADSSNTQKYVLYGYNNVLNLGYSGWDYIQANLPIKSSHDISVPSITINGWKLTISG